jgi:hypothetical protein
LETVYNDYKLNYSLNYDLKKFWSLEICGSSRVILYTNIRLGRKLLTTQF